MLLWAIWMDTGQPKYLFKLLKWINDLRIRKDGFGQMTKQKKDILAGFVDDDSATTIIREFDKLYTQEFLDGLPEEERNNLHNSIGRDGYVRGFNACLKLIKERVK